MQQVSTVIGQALSPTGHYRKRDGDWGYLAPVDFDDRQPSYIPINVEHAEHDVRGSVIHIERTGNGELWIVSVVDIPAPTRQRDDHGQRHYSVGAEGRQSSVDELSGRIRRIRLQHVSIEPAGTAGSNVGPLVWMPFDVRDEIPDADADVWRFRGSLRPMLARAHEAHTRRQRGDAIVIIDVEAAE